MIRDKFLTKVFVFPLDENHDTTKSPFFPRSPSLGSWTALSESFDAGKNPNNTHPLSSIVTFNINSTLCEPWSTFHSTMKFLLKLTLLANCFIGSCPSLSCVASPCKGHEVINTIKQDKIAITFCVNLNALAVFIVNFRLPKRERA